MVEVTICFMVIWPFQQILICLEKLHISFISCCIIPMGNVTVTQESLNK